MEKIKQFIHSEQGKDILIVLVVILVGLGAFELGRLSKNSSSGSGGLKIEYPGGESALQAANVLSAVNPLNVTKPAQSAATSAGGFFASSRGKKYYPVGCAAGNNIKKENRIYFSSSSEAQTAGYEPSSSCK